MFKLWFKRAPDIDDQNTGHFIFQHTQGYAYVPYNGGAGFTVRRSMNATTPAGIVPGPTHKLNDPTVTGNSSGTLLLSPLSHPVNPALGGATSSNDSRG